MTVALIQPDNKEAIYAVESGRKYVIVKSRTANKYELTAPAK